jgi:hypothetical protein
LAKNNCHFYYFPWLLYSASWNALWRFIQLPVITVIRCHYSYWYKMLYSDIPTMELSFWWSPSYYNIEINSSPLSLNPHKRIRVSRSGKWIYNSIISLIYIIFFSERAVVEISTVLTSFLKLYDVRATCFRRKSLVVLTAFLN